MRIGVDLDGVCFDFPASLRRYLETLGFSGLPTGEVRRWEFYEDWGLTLDEFLGYCNDGVDAGYVFSGPARDRAPQAIRALKNAGHEIHIVTDRSFGKNPIASEDATLHWLYGHDIPFDSLTFSPDKTSVPTDVFIEDKLQNYDALAASGCKPYLVDRPWNRFPYAGLACERRRVGSIAEFAWIVTGAWPR